MLLLNPGPVTLSERVRGSMLAPDLCHRESEFFDLQDEARQRLLAVYALDPAQWCAVLLTASGTGAVESMVSTLVPQDGRVLVAENGVYGERMAQILPRWRGASRALLVMAARHSLTSPWCITRRRLAGSTSCRRSRIYAGSTA